MDYRDLAERAVRYAGSLGAREAVVRIHRIEYELMVIDNGIVREHSFTIASGAAIDVYTEKGRGLAYTSSLDWSSVSEAIRLALESTLPARLSDLQEVNPANLSYTSRVAVNPMDVDVSEKIDLLASLNREAASIKGASSVTTRLGVERDYRLIARIDGSISWREVTLVGLAHSTVAKTNGVAERVADSRSFEGGWEKIRSHNWRDFILEITTTAVKASQARMPPAGVYEAVVDNKLIGTVIHEALGHAVEGDLVSAGASVVAGRLGEKIASENVTIIDEGLVEGGYPILFDDEGVPKERVLVVDRGVLRGYLTSRAVARDLNLPATGNARAMNFRYPAIVRQTNFYLAPGDYKVEEIFDGLNGIYLKGVGGGGGQVDTATGTFTFNSGPSYLVRNGEISEIVRSTLISGRILDFLSRVKAVARDLAVETSVFGGCGKDGQLARVGLGGPHVRVEGVVVGGR